jgi:hypothetical protein
MSTGSALKTMVLALGGMVVVFFVVGALLADHYFVESHRTIAAPPAVVGKLVGDFDAWEQWSTMKVALGPQVQRTVTGAAGAAGHRVEWSGSAGGASLTLVTVEPGKVVYEYHSRRGAGPEMDLAGRGGITYVAQGAGTLVTWHDEGQWGNYGMRWVGWFGGLQERIRQIQTSSLEGLQHAVEAPAAPAAVETPK